MMNCVGCGRLLNAYADGELELETALSIEEHVQSCARCRGSFESLRAVSAALGRACGLERAPQRLRDRLRSRLAGAAASPRAPAWRSSALLAVPGIVALALAGWLMLAEPWREGRPIAATPTRVVYHMATGENTGAALRTLKNHLDAAPGLKVVVVAHNNGIEFLLRGARDEAGRHYAAIVREFRTQGVEFRVCTNTLTRRQIDTKEVIDEAVLVPSGIAEIGRLQGQEGYLYLRL
jgi:hypothetical protein